MHYKTHLKASTGGLSQALQKGTFTAVDLSHYTRESGIMHSLCIMHLSMSMVITPICVIFFFCLGFEWMVVHNLNCLSVNKDSAIDTSNDLSSGI